MRFATARQLLLRHAQDPQMLETIAKILGGNPWESRVLALLGRLGPLANPAVLGWLTLWLRPFSLAWLTKEMFVARFFRPADHAG
jgi:hypothetical protein